jgi:P4 family phage/plasmid primase-like protien
MIKKANSLVQAGYDVFPCTPNGKPPITKNGYKDASNDPNIIKKWWSNNPLANIGLPTGSSSNLVVVDVDVKGNADGLNSLIQLEMEVGVLNTYAVSTPSGGMHYYFTHPNQPIKNRVGMRDGIDIRADGGYVLAVGSVIDEVAYTAIDPSISINPLPPKLLDLLTGKVAANDPSYRYPTERATYGVSEGSRNDSLFRLTSSLVGQGVAYEAAMPIVLGAADDCNPPLSHIETMQVLDSAYSRYEPNVNPTDSGNADRLLRLFEGDLRFVVEFHKWLIWDQGRWFFDEGKSIYGKAEKAIKHIIGEAQAMADEEARRKLIHHSLKSESQRSIIAMEFLARFKSGIPLNQSDLDKNPMLLGLNNGVLDLNSGLLRDDAAKESFITKRACVDYDQNATCPDWLDFLEQTTGGDQDYVDYIQRAVGYSLTGKTNEQVLFFLYGIGANGKSTFVNIIQQLLGDYAQQSPSSTFMAKKTGSINNDIARLRGSRMVATTETEEGSRFDESQLKLLTGGDRVAARFLHQEHFEFQPAFKLWISGNHKPYIKGNDEGIWRRIKLLPFEHSVPKDKQDKDLPMKLAAELSGILNWAIEGCLEWQSNGLGSCAIVDQATSSYRSDMDVIQSWTSDCCTSVPNNVERASALFHSYKSWASDNCEWLMSERQFSRKLIDRGLSRGRDSKGSYYTGLKLNPTGAF